MIIPIRCFTCGKVIADKYEYYLKEVEKLQKKDDYPNQNPPSRKGKEKVTEEEPPVHKQFDSLHPGPILVNLGLYRYCCRRHMISTVYMMETI
jgi:DNA-directed RNA polymerase I, II, and III subunit RPABC5